MTNTELHVFAGVNILYFIMAKLEISFTWQYLDPDSPFYYLSQSHTAPPPLNLKMESMLKQTGISTFFQ